jgi:XTP/dITP diphosphohydrolase
MKKLILATHNEYKAVEFKLILPQFRVQTLADLKYDQEIAETASDLEGNSLLKAETILRQFGHIVVSDDSGLEVQALNGAPGVYSARYAGEQKDDQQNTEKLLHELKGITNRNAQFRTVISLMSSNDTLQFEGIVEGAIAYEPKGDKGFGYDPIFIPNGFQKTFAELTSNEKNKISHRANAIKKLVAFLEKNPTFC